MAHHRSNAGAGLDAGSGPLPPRFHCGPFSVLSAAPPGFDSARPHSLALRFDPAGARFALALLDAEGRALLSLGPYPEEEAVAAWRRLGLASGLPLAIEGPDGSVEIPYPQIGRVRLGGRRQRRRHGGLSGRRPRFLTRRKTGRFPTRPRVHREREMVGRREV
ncbi:MAG TPA: DUF6101 family protein [Microvirga sp.]|jgi:hypothetical protein|nr:DUF6101 family protein [Microvirga sp.]